MSEIMEGVTEYAEGYEVELSEVEGRPVVVAYSEAMCRQTEVDLLQLIAWVRANRPELLDE